MDPANAELPPVNGEEEVLVCHRIRRSRPDRVMLPLIVSMANEADDMPGPPSAPETLTTENPGIRRSVPVSATPVEMQAIERRMARVSDVLTVIESLLSRWRRSDNIFPGRISGLPAGLTCFDLSHVPRMLMTIRCRNPGQIGRNYPAWPDISFKSRFQKKMGTHLNLAWAKLF